MNKYYNKEIPTEIYCLYGERQCGKTYYESNKLKEDKEIIKKFYSKPLWIIMTILSILFYSGIIMIIIDLCKR